MSLRIVTVREIRVNSNVRSFHLNPGSPESLKPQGIFRKRFLLFSTPVIFVDRPVTYSILARYSGNVQQLFNQQELFLDYCSGNRGVRILYDSFFKEAMNVEYDPSRLEDFLCTVLKKKVRIVKILPNDNTRIADEAMLLITDIVVELEDGALANVEIQKVGYLFPGARCACYSADLLLRQYKRIRDRAKKKFSYKNIRNVYLIVLFESSPAEFKAYPNEFYHYGKVEFDTGLNLGRACAEE